MWYYLKPEFNFQLFPVHNKLNHCTVYVRLNRNRCDQIQFLLTLLQNFPRMAKISASYQFNHTGDARNSEKLTTIPDFFKSYKESCFDSWSQFHQHQLNNCYICIAKIKSTTDIFFRMCNILTQKSSTTESTVLQMSTFLPPC